MSMDLRSVAIYLATFGMSLFFFALAERQYARVDAAKGEARSLAGRQAARRFDGHVWAFLGILSLSLLAGLRAETVGVDAKNYPIFYMDSAVLYRDFGAMLQDPNIDFATEPLNAVVVWTCSRFTQDTGPLLFFYQLFTVFPVFLAAYRMRDRAPLAMAMAVYVFFFYNNSLNMMRQSVACALLLLAAVRVLRGRRVGLLDVLLVVSSFLFHKSGVYGFILLAGASGAFFTSRRWLKIALVVAVVVLPSALAPLGELLVSAGLMESHMETYFDIFITGNVEKDWFIDPLGGYSISYLVMYSTLVLLPNLLGGKFLSPDAPNGDIEGGRIASYVGFLTKLGLLLYVVLLFALNSMYGGRFSLFFDFFLIVAIPLSCSGENKPVKCLVANALLMCVWFCWVMVLGWSGSQVYEFDL